MSSRPLTPDDLVELEHIKRLKYRYLRAVDTKDFDDLVHVLTPDARAAYAGGAYTFEGRDAILAFLRNAMGSHDMLTSHRCHHPEVELTTDDTASGTWALDDVVLLLDWGLTVRGSAFYSDDYVRTPEGWRISSTGYRRVYEEVEVRRSEPDLRITAHWWSTGGASTLPAG